MPVRPVRVAPAFLVRMAGTRFEEIERLGTPRSAAAAREARALSDAVEAAAAATAAAVRRLGAGSSGAAARHWQRLRNRIQGRDPLDPEDEAADPALAAYGAAVRALTSAKSDIERTLGDEMDRARRALQEVAAGPLRRFAAFGSDSLSEKVFDREHLDQALHAPLPRRTSAVRKNERLLALYLQRVCTKNDTVTEFGPLVWGRVDPKEPGFRGTLADGIATRGVFLEKWAIDALLAAMNADPSVRPEVAPRPHPQGRLEGDRWIRADESREVPLDPADRALLERCDGMTPAHALGSPDRLATLTEAGVLVWRAEDVALDRRRIEFLLDEVRRWRPGAARDRWLPQVESMASIPTRFAAETDTDRRLAIMRETRDALRALGASSQPAEGSRQLYAATNPIAETCVRHGDVALGEAVARRLVEDARPWIELARHAFGYAMHKVSRRLAEIHRAAAPASGGRLPLAVFFRKAKEAGYPLFGPSLYDTAVQAWTEVRAAFAEATAGRDASASEWEIGAAELDAVRARVPFDPIDEFSWPSADIQIQAASSEAMARGEFDLVLAEVHPAASFFITGTEWCPDLDAVKTAIARMTRGRPFMNWGAGADAVVHTIPYFLPFASQWTCCAPVRLRPGWPAVPPGQAAVTLDERTGDVTVVDARDGRALGSFARFWAAQHGVHPFIFTREPDSPRLRMGRVVVQRRLWTVRIDELPGGPFADRPADLLLAIERLRAARGLPRCIYTRPTQERLATLGISGNDKDAKPIFVDLESFLGIEILEYWLRKYGQLEVSEMLPDRDGLLLHDSKGRYTFELRTLLEPTDG